MRHHSPQVSALCRQTSVKIEFLECEPNPSQMLRMGENNNTQSIADYLAQLLKDKKQLAAFPNVFVHMERLLDDGKSESENNDEDPPDNTSLQ